MLSRGQVLHPAMMAAIFQRSKEKRRTTGKEMTRTFKYILFNIKKCVNHIMVHLTHQGSTKPQIAQLANQVTGKLSLLGVWNQLGGVNNRQMGNSSSERF